MCVNLVILPLLSEAKGVNWFLHKDIFLEIIW